MKVLSVFLMGLFLVCSTSMGLSANDVKKIKGIWDVQVPDAPYGYQEFSITVKEADGSYKADIKGENVNLKDQKLTDSKGLLVTEVYVGEYVDITIWEEDGIVKGFAETSIGKLPMTFKKTEK